MDIPRINPTSEKMLLSLCAFSLLDPSDVSMRVAEKSSRLRRKNAMRNAYYEFDQRICQFFYNLDINLCWAYNFQNQKLFDKRYIRVYIHWVEK